MTVDEGGRRGPLTATQRRWLFGILAVAAVLRLVWFFWAKTSPPGHFMDAGDQFSYWYYGNEIAGGRGYVSYVGHEATAYYPIGYPTILAAIIWVTVRIPFVDPDLLRVLNLVHVVVSVATVALVFVVGRRLLGVRAALVAAALMAGFPNLIFQVTTLQLETMFIFTTMAALAIIVGHDWSSGPPSDGCWRSGRCWRCRPRSGRSRCRCSSGCSWPSSRSGSGGAGCSRPWRSRSSC